MKSNLLAVVALSAVSLSSLAIADVYTGVSVGFVTIEESDVSNEVTPTVIQGKVGVQFNPYVGTELRIGGGLSDDDLSERVNVGIDDYHSFLGTLSIPNSSYVTPYGVAGFTRGQIIYHHDNWDDDTGVVQSDNVIQYGIGVNIANGSPLAVNVEWSRLTNDDLRDSDVDVDVITVGVKYDY